MKKCPFCAEEIQDDAIKCRYCGSALGPAGPEKLISRIHPSMKPILGVYAICAIVCIGILVLVNKENGSMMAVLPVVIVAFGFGLIFQIKRNTTRYTLTNQNLTVEQGVFGKTAKHIPLHKVQDVTVRRTVMDRIFNMGTIVVESAGATGQVPEINVDSPVQVCQDILAQVASSKGGE